VDTKQPVNLNRRDILAPLSKSALAGALLAGLAATPPAAAASEKPNPNASAHEQIRNLLAMYSYLLDSADYQKWGALFGEKGTLELNGTVWAQGSAGLAKKMAEVMAATPTPVTGITGKHMYRHIFTNTHIDVDEAAGIAEAKSYFFVLHVFEGMPPVIRGGGRYRDGFARTNGVWHYTAKRMDFDWSDA
jgi:hypothetical protein